MHSQRSLLALLLFGSLAQVENGKPRLMGRQRLLIVLLTVGVVLDLLISVSLGYVAVQARNASNQAHIVKVASYEACVANNDAKQADLKRWDDVLTLIKDGHATPALLAFIAGVRRSNVTADAPRDCGRLAP